VPPPSTTTTSRPGRLLAALVVLIVVMLLGVLGGSLAGPSTWHKRFKVGLGLDLSSGTTVTLKAVTPRGKAPSPAAMGLALSIMNSRVNGAGFNGATVVPQGTDLINVTVPGKSAQQVVNLVGTTALLRFRQVILVAPNYASTSTPTPTPTPSATPTPTPSASTKSKASPSPSRSSAALGRSSANSALAVSARRLAGAVAAAAKTKPKASASPTPSPSPSPSPSASVTPKLSTTTDPSASGNASLLSPAVKALFDKLNCANPNWKSQIYGSATAATPAYDDVSSQTVACYQGLKYALDRSTVTGEMLKLGGSSTQLQTSGDWWVNLTFNGQGSAAFGALTSKMFSAYSGSSSNVQNEFAIVLDGVPVATPYVAAVLNTGSATIQGTFTQTQADNLANVLNYGALPLSFTPDQAQSISPQLGASQLHAGLLAGAIGLLLVVVYAFLYYRGLGVVSVASLGIAALVSYLAVVLLSLYESFALSLAGIAGLIVAIGITADSFVVFFERLRDEVRDGKSLRAAVERGWQRARRTILVSDTVSFIAAAVLYKFAVSDVQNFAFTLGLTTLVDVVVVFLFTKPMITLLARTEFYGGGHKLSGLDPARLGARSPWRGSRRQVARPQAGRAQPGQAQAGRVPGGASATAPPRTNPKEA
jgi:preprotein translocase subunit SecD